MSDFPDNPMEGVEPTLVDAVTNPSMAPVDDAAGGPTADHDEDEPSDEKAATQLGELS